MTTEEFPGRPVHKPHRKYYTGWSNAGGEIVLMYRDPNSGKRLKETIDPKDHPWYFPIRAEDAAKLTPSNHKWLAENCEGACVKDDPYYPDRYKRVYIQPAFRPIDQQKVVQRIGEKENWVAPLIRAERGGGFDLPEDPTRWKPLHTAVEMLRRRKIEPLEADLSPLQRFVTDNEIKIADRLRACYLDIETEDKHGFQDKEQNRILSIAWRGDRPDDPLDRGYVATPALTDDAERRMLEEFRRDVLAKYDVIVAWNGDGFDFPMLIARFAKLQIRWNWRVTLTADLLPMFRRNYTKGASELSSFSLDAMGHAVLGIPKLDWRTEFRTAHPGVPATYTNLWQHAPDLLRRYNELDVQILAGLDAKTGFLEVEQTLARISGCFANAANVSHKVDGMMLREGLVRGVRWPTRWFREPDAKFAGAFVFEPVVGLHENVVALDFKALYPSMMRSFNISPETLVKKDKRAGVDQAILCRCPEVEIDGKMRGGSTFRTDVRGIMPALFVHTTDERRRYQKMAQDAQKKAGTVKDDAVQRFERLAYAYKVTGLSFYGALGDMFSRFYDPELGEAVTLSGQWFTKSTAAVAASVGIEKKYGDTDSVYATIKRAKSVEDAAARAADFCRSMAEMYEKWIREFGCRPEWNAVELEFEDVYGRLLLLAKKRYAGHLVWHKGARADDLEVKGLEMQRSDQSRLTRDMQRAVLEGILRQGMTAKEIADKIIQPAFDRCAEGKMLVDELVIGKGVGKDPDTYKAVGLHVKLAKQIRATGREFFVGMKIEYVVTGVNPLNGVTREEYEAGGHKYDPTYYWDHIIFPATGRVLLGAYPDMDPRIWVHSYRKRRKAEFDKLAGWLLKPKTMIRALVQIHRTSRGVLQPEDVAALMSKPRVMMRKVAR